MKVITTASKLPEGEGGLIGARTSKKLRGPELGCLIRKAPAEKGPVAGSAALTYETLVLSNDRPSVAPTVVGKLLPCIVTVNVFPGSGVALLGTTLIAALDETVTLAWV